MNHSGGFPVIWAKVSSRFTDQWLPLYIHMDDSAAIIDKLWQEWVSDSVKTIIRNSLNLDESDTRAVLRFLSATHDLGKCMPSFQIKRIPENPVFENSVRDRLDYIGLSYRTDLTEPNAIGHATLSEYLLESAGISRTLAVVVGGHHGKPPSSELSKIPGYPANTGLSDPAWCSLQREFLNYALTIADLEIEFVKKCKLSSPAQALVSGLVIMADWIASNEYLFPLYKDGVCDESSENRIEGGWNLLDLPPRWNEKMLPPVDELCEIRFGFKPRPFQKDALNVAFQCTSPGLYIVEAPMGEGKTEAALGMAEELALKFGQTGVFFALPTQATADGVFPRVVKWIRNVSECKPSPRTIFLAHGKSKFNKVYSNIPTNRNSNTDDPLVVHEWFHGKKKGILSDFVIGTVDQVLMAGLKRRHLALRHLGLVGKVIIIDEVHAYDVYMGSYLEKCLTWFGAYEIPVILLSATLPLSRRNSLIESYLRGRRIHAPKGDWLSDTSYPLITYTDGGQVQSVAPPGSNRKLEIRIFRILDCDLMSKIESCSSRGGYVGIIVNTVSRAQNIYTQLAQRFGKESVRLLHSRFTNIDRTKNEVEVMEMLNEGRIIPPYRMFVVGTQVMEQSLDFDFDVLFTDLCPMDLLIQRMGRLHRHHNVRPEGLETPTCYVIDDGFVQKVSEAVYSRYQLLNTEVLLPERIVFPKDIPQLVQSAYGNPLEVPNHLKDKYRKALEEVRYEQGNKEQKAKTYQIFLPTEPNLLKWLDNDLTGEEELMARAAVRDTEESIEVILVKSCGNGTYQYVAGEEAGTQIPLDIDEESAFILAGSKVALPYKLTKNGHIQKTVEELTQIQDSIPSSWKESYWLCDSVFLPLDENNLVQLKYCKLRYDVDLGLREIVND